ncbi:MAG: response regulator [Gaiellales bacterium]
MAKTLLLADDSVTIQKVVNISFANEDVTLVTVDNGDDAVERAVETRPDLILADVVMPGKSGYEVCEAIKANPDLAHIPVLLLTGTFEAFDEERAQRVGAAGHVAKPFEAQTLVSKVKQLLAEAPPSQPALEPVAEPAPVAPPEAVTAPSSDDSSGGDSFDFFDDDLGELATPAASPDSDQAIGFEDSDSAFAFGGGEPAALAWSEPLDAPQPDVAAPLAPPPPDRTVAILPDEPPQGGPADDALDALLADAPQESPAAPQEVPLAEPPQEASAPEFASEQDGESESDFEDPLSPIVPVQPADDSFEFAFQAEPAADDSLSPESAPDGGLMSIESEDLAQATVLDPNGASGYDVSSSDLGDPLSAGPDFPADAWSPLSPAAPEPVAAAEPMEALLAPALLEPEPEAPADLPPTPLSEPATAELLPPPLPEPAAAERLPPPMSEPAAAELLPRPLPEPAAADLSPPLIPEPEPFETARPLSQEAALSTDSLLEAIAPALREQVHDTLEKIAWESFGNVAEKIVSQTVELVEKVAWEVIPQLAETLIKEEIRRMKGESED